MRKTFIQNKTSEINPPSTGWYDTDKGQLFWWASQTVWSCNNERVSEEYPKFWYEEISLPAVQGETPEPDGWVNSSGQIMDKKRTENYRQAWPKAELKPVWFSPPPVRLPTDEQIRCLLVDIDKSIIDCTDAHLPYDEEQYCKKMIQATKKWFSALSPPVVSKTAVQIEAEVSQIIEDANTEEGININRITTELSEYCVSLLSAQGEGKKPLSDKQKGLINKYFIQKIVRSEFFNGEPMLQAVDEDAEYFVLRLDKNTRDVNHLNACRKAINIYADEIRDYLPVLSADLKQKYPVSPAAHVNGKEGEDAK